MWWIVFGLLFVFAGTWIFRLQRDMMAVRAASQELEAVVMDECTTAAALVHRALQARKDVFYDGAYHVTDDDLDRDMIEFLLDHGVIDEDDVVRSL